VWIGLRPDILFIKRMKNLKEGGRDNGGEVKGGGIL